MVWTGRAYALAGMHNLLFRASHPISTCLGFCKNWICSDLAFYISRRDIRLESNQRVGGFADPLLLFRPHFFRLAVLKNYPGKRL